MKDVARSLDEFHLPKVGVFYQQIRRYSLGFSLFEINIPVPTADLLHNILPPKVVFKWLKG
jgi:hypothetical protein